MISPEQVPQAAWRAMRDQMREGIRNEATLIAAALNAWPGMNAKAATDHVMLLNSTPALILPITETSTKENNNG